MWLLNFFRPNSSSLRLGTYSMIRNKAVRYIRSVLQAPQGVAALIAYHLITQTGWTVTSRRHSLLTVHVNVPSTASR